MNLKHALLCIDCDEVFMAEESPCNPRCPRCASSVLIPLAVWVRSWSAFEGSEEEPGKAARNGKSSREPRLRVVYPALTAA